MIITKKEFIKASRKAMYEVIDESFENKDDSSATEGIVWTTAVKFLTESRTIFGESDQIDISEEEFIDKLDDFSTTACMRLADVGEDKALGFTALLTGILCAAVNGQITRNIEKQLFKKEESNGNN